MKWRQWLFRILGYAGTVAVPVLAACSALTGVGIPGAIVAACATVGGGFLHAADPPKWVAAVVNKLSPPAAGP
jgi:hypothetical protein